MYIEELILEGFKTYAHRTVIGPFDKEFNAITGLNGHGKSNVLDAICFVLGITTLSQVRVTKLEELIYKNGAAGITKASVTIIFNNEDAAQSPAGYEKYERITVTRQIQIDRPSKYLINGHTAALRKVRDLFLSVQLNIDNPNFLIMQGRITKVINMKPPEVLSMLEEATGTSNYEKKKEKAHKSLAKQQQRMDEVDRVLRDEITPSLEKRRKESEHYKRWVRNKEDIDRLTRFVKAHQYWHTSKVLEDSSGQLDAMNAESVSLQESLRALLAQLDANKRDVIKYTKRRDEEKSEAFEALEHRERELGKDVVQLKSQLQHQRELAANEEKHIADCNERIAKGSTRLQQKQEALEAATQQFEELAARIKELEAAGVQLQHNYKAAEMGVATGSGTEGSLTNQLMQQKEAAQKASTEAEKLRMRLEADEKELRKGKQEVEAIGQESSREEKEHRKLVKRARALSVELEGLSFDPQRQQELEEERRALLHQRQTLRDEVSRTAASAGLAYSGDVERAGVSPDDVFGPVARLMQAKDKNALVALEVVAGRKLRNVVIASERIGRALLKANARERATFLPLDRMQTRDLSGKVAAAKQLVGKENVHLALDLVQYSERMEPAMRHVFGQTLVCKRAEDAKRVAFDPAVRARVVTYEGDVYDPSGTLTGGSKGRLGQKLSKAMEINEKQAKLDSIRKRLHQVNEELQQLQLHRQRYVDAQQQLQLVQTRAKLLEERMATSQAHQLRARVDELEAAIAAGRTRIAECEQRAEEAHQQHKKLEQMIRDFSSSKDVQLRKIKQEMQKTKHALTSAKNKIDSCRERKDTLEAEAGDLEEQLRAARQQLALSTESAQALKTHVEEVAQQLQQKEEEHGEVEQQLQQARQNLRACSDKIAQLMKTQAELMAAVADNEVQGKDLEHKAQRFTKDIRAAQLNVAAMERENPWIAAEKQFFGNPGTNYDFAARDPKAAQKRLAEFMQEQSKLEGSINKKVASMISAAEEKYNELQKKKAQVEHDRGEILKTIEDLDRKKVATITHTYEKVNRDFGAIFSRLLQGTAAKLEPVDGDVLNGLEIKVAFGGVWKESLAELSGGQRSLLALSLILALCRFKPAPMYILDEIDSALDLSHTQNIGHIISHHFPNSQFIVVSLKPGMFENANTLFNVQMRNGVSGVSRTVTKQVQKKRKK